LTRRTSRPQKSNVRQVPIELLSTELFDLRFSEGVSPEIHELTSSIRKHGVIEPIIVRPARQPNHHGFIKKKFEVICGHRRLEASKFAHFSSVPCLVTNLEDREALELALVENIQRRNLNPIEEAEAFKRYVVNYGRGSITRLGEMIGKSEVYVSHRLLLLGLPSSIVNRISRRLLNASQAAELVWLPVPRKQEELADEIVKNNLTSKQTREIVAILKRKRASVREAIRQTNTMQESETKKVVLRESDYVDFSPPELAPSSHEPSDLRLMSHCILILRSCLAGLDRIVEDAEDSELRQDFMKYRQLIHTLLDAGLSRHAEVRKTAETGTVQRVKSDTLDKPMTTWSSNA
jgi:ParB family transcriptional regulator, chromosome partitioning protein